MPKRSQRSRSLRKLRITTPGGRRVTHFKAKKNAKAKCSVCKKPLSGVPVGMDSQIAKLSKTERRPERPFGGNLCPSCSRREIKKRLYESIQ